MFPGLNLFQDYWRERLKAKKTATVFLKMKAKRVINLSGSSSVNSYIQQIHSGLTFVLDSEFITNGIYTIEADEKRVKFYGDNYYQVYSLSIPEELTANSLINSVKLGLAAERVTPVVFKIIVKYFEEHIEEIVEGIVRLRKYND